ncbi:hypothetical protein HMPREF3214_00610 [Alloscardovia omnicolens]|nr:hypothetical protein HMPREF3214_00610 [Alloscardovia omnicolens]
MGTAITLVSVAGSVPFLCVFLTNFASRITHPLIQHQFSNDLHASAHQKSQ